MPKKITAAIIQIKPEYLDLKNSVAKAIRCIEEAASQGAELIAFGETWLTGYPTWIDHIPKACLWDYGPTKEVYALLRENSATVPGQEINAIAAAAKKHGVTVVMGLNERVDHGKGNGTLYNSLITIGSDGQFLNHHRKLVPTFTERLIWGQGDGDGLNAVSTNVGRVGGLICWEHWMPMARQTLHEAGEHIHISVWPTVNEMHQIASRHYAFEGKCYVLASGLIESVSDLPSQFELPAELEENPNRLLQRGSSAIIGPDGNYIAGPVYDEETIVMGEIELNKINEEKITLDVTGHYFRKDIFSYQVKKGQRDR